MATLFPVRYQDGGIQLVVTDLASGGYGSTLMHQRSYSNQLSEDSNVGQGYNWLITNIPYLLEGDEGAISVVRSTVAPMWFKLTETGYVGQYGAKATLSHDTVNNLIVVSMPDGTRLVFNDFDGFRPHGSFVRQIEPGGAVTEANTITRTLVETLTRTGMFEGQTLVETFTYSLADSITNLTLSRQLGTDPAIDVLRVAYEYYGVGEDNGTPGDLKLVRQQVPTDSGWADTAVTYYRYYDGIEPNGFRHGLKFVVEAATFAKMVAASLDPLTVTDSVLATYADNYFEYGTKDRVVLERIDGGSRTFTFDFTESHLDDGPNTWSTKTVETLPDDTQNVVYANYLGQAMLFIHRSSAGDGSSSSGDGGVQEWANYTRFNDNARAVLFAYPSAIVGYDDGEPDLGVELYTDQGLIELTEYYDVTGSGAATGYVSAYKIQNGSEGDEIVLQTLEYTTRTAGGETIFPVSKETAYRNENGTGEIETSYEYTYHSGTTQIEQRTTTLPAIPLEQNGNGIAATRKDYFDDRGRLTWSMDERGYITHQVYDLGTGALIQLINDVDTSIVSGAPSGWTTPADGGLNLVTDYLSDDQGRTTQILGPVHTIDIDGTATEIRRASWMVYDDVNHITYSGQGYQTEDSSELESVLINPVSITKTDADGKVLEQIQAISEETTGTLAEIIDDAGGGADAFPQSSYSRWSTVQYIDCCLAVSQRAYHTIPASGIGTDGTNYDQTNFGYDVMKRRNRTVTPGGTITRLIYDARGKVASTWMGTNDDGATADDPSGGGVDPDNNMVVITSNVYDDGEAGLDGNLTVQTQHVDAETDRVTYFFYDWRDRQVDTDGEIDFFQRVTYDNLNYVVMAQRYDTTVEGNLIGQSETLYDDRGRVFRSIRYGVNPETGVVGNHLTDNKWFDDAGNVIESLPSGARLFTKFVYDSLGRRSAQYLGYTPVPEGSSSSSSAENDPASVDTAVILEQSETSYDDASNATKTLGRKRYHNAPDTELGPLQDPSNDPKARVTYIATYSDALGRLQASANYGTNGGTALTRPDTIPTASDDILVTLTTYDEAGNTLSTTDAAGMVARMGYDDRGRVVEQIQNYRPSSDISSSSSSEFQGSSSSSSGENCCDGSDDVNVTVLTTYNADGNIETFTALNTTTGDQVTTYLYGTTLDDSSIAASTLKRKEISPDSADESDAVALAYNRQSQITNRTDQNGTVHAYTYDSLGRIVHDAATHLGANVNDTVLRITTTYNSRSLPEHITSHDNANPAEGSIVNDVKYVYNSFEQIATEYHSHDGAVNESLTPSIRHAYADGTDNTIRQEALIYPNGRRLTYSYGDSTRMDDLLSRVESLIDFDDVTSVINYKYLGLSRVVEGDRPQPQMKWSVITDQGGTDPLTGDIYRGLDTFGRTSDNQWFSYGGPANIDLDRVQYGYNRLGRRVWRRNAVADSLDKHFDEAYAYDGVQRLVNMARGTLNATVPMISDEVLRQCWTLDAAGNWTKFKESDDGAGAWTMTQSRESNSANQLTDITNVGVPPWAQPEYDAVGNITAMPQPANPTDAYGAEYDAWNRLTSLTDTSTSELVSRYAYDGRGFRITHATFSDGMAYAHKQFYYNRRWQCLETRQEGDSSSSEGSGHQFVWGMRYIDDLVLRDAGSELSPSDGRLYAIQDATWNTTALTDTSGNVVQRFCYDPYGECSFLESDFSAGGNQYSWTTLYTGQNLELDSLLICFRSRYSHCTLGSFLTKDSFMYRAWENLYRMYFVINGTDPSGYVESSDYGESEMWRTGKGVGDDSDKVTSLYCEAARKYSQNGWLNCACSVSSDIDKGIDLIDFTVGWFGTKGSVAEDKSGWFRCTRLCMQKRWYNAIQHKEKGVPLRDGSKWKQWCDKCQPHSNSMECCAEQVTAEQSELQSCFDHCGKWDFGNTFPVNVSGVSGDFNDLEKRIKFGQEKCCTDKMYHPERNPDWFTFTPMN